MQGQESRNGSSGRLQTPGMGFRPQALEALVASWVRQGYYSFYSICQAPLCANACVVAWPSPQAVPTSPTYAPWLWDGGVG